MERERPHGAQPFQGAESRPSARIPLRRRFLAVRLTLLLVTLCSVVVWGLRVELRRHARMGWQRTLPVEVVLLRNGFVPPETLAALEQALPRLEAALQGELRRYRPEAPRPFAFRPLGTVRVSDAPPSPPDSGRLWDRASHYLQLSRYLDDVHHRGGLGRQGDRLRLYVVVEPPRNRSRFVEGFGGGDIGVVRTAMDGTNIDQALLAMGHELLHCVGATDKYDDEGHAIESVGLAEPSRSPRYPQRYAEIMVGEIAVEPGRGQIIDSLADVRVGPLTAQEVGWAR